MSKLVNELLGICLLLIVGFCLLEKPAQDKIIRNIEVFFNQYRDEYVDKSSSDNEIDLTLLYDEETLKHFDDVCYHSGDVISEQTRKTRLSRWHTDVVFYIEGNPETYMINEVDKVINELNSIIKTINIRRTSIKSESNVPIFFGSQDDFIQRNNIKNKSQINFIKNSSGYAITGFKPGDYIGKFNNLTSALVLVDITIIKSKKLTKHIIREEITQSLGFSCDTWNQPNSIFYEGSSKVTEYSKMDIDIINILYNIL